MVIGTLDLAHVLVALSVLMVAAHAGAGIYKLLRQPPVIGEIAGGLLLGPTVLGAVSPSAQAWLFPKEGPTASVLGTFFQLGFLLLVYLTGTELRGRVSRAERRTISLVAVSGLVVPFAGGLLIAHVNGVDDLSGPHGTPLALALLLGMAIAVTSVPVISQIMLDLGVIHTVFAKIVLGVAVLEDIVLYAVLAVILGVAEAESARRGVGAMVGTVSLPWSVIYLSVVPLVLLGSFMWRGTRIFARFSRSRWNLVEDRSPTAFRLVFVFALAAICMGLGVDPMFGALAAGLCGGDGDPREVKAHETLRTISMAFFVPVYFAIVGLKLDLIHHFNAIFFLWFLVVACVVKSASVWTGARLAGQDSASSANLAVAMNARGGPGIVLASVTFGAGIINVGFFTCLVVLSIVTSQIAGVWLGRVVARGRPLVSCTPVAPA